MPARRSALALLIAAAAPAAAATPALAAAATPATAAAQSSARLPLGPPGLPERRATTRVAPGLAWTRIVRGAGAGGGGPWRVHVLSVEPPALTGRLGSVLATGRIPGRETVGAMARRTGALAGVNGGFFVGAGAGNGDPVGALASGGELLSEPIDGRSSLLVPRGPAARPRIASLEFAGAATVGARRRLLDGINRPAGVIPNCGGRGGDRPTERPRHALDCTDPSELVLFTPRWGGRTPRARGAVEAVVRGGRVAALRRGGGVLVPRSGSVLTATGAAAAFLARAAPGDPATAATALRARGEPLLVSGHEAIVSGGPRLLTAGRVAVRSAAEGFGPPGNRALHRRFVLARNPRTLAGVTGDGSLLLVTVDGRRRGFSAGVSLLEAARVMRALGASDALNLDGGGSSAMAVRGRIVNRPSDRAGERPVADGLFVLP